MEASKLLRQWRDSHAWSQLRAAEELGICQAHYSKLETRGADVRVALALQIQERTGGLVPITAWVMSSKKKRRAA